MIIMIGYAIISFLLDGLLSGYLNASIVNANYFMTIYSVVSLVIMLNFFDEYQKYRYILLIMGILFDIVYTNTFLLNIFLFYVIYFMIDKLNYFLSDSLVMVIIKAYLGICLYHTLSYLILMFSDYGYYPIDMLGRVLVGSIISTIIYAAGSYLLIKKIFLRLYSKKIK